MADDPRFDEQEAALVLRRAAQLDERKRGEAGDGRSFSLGELEDAVEDLGIDRALVRTAADQLAIAEVRNQAPWVLGGKTDLLFETKLEGRVGEAGFEAMVEVMRRNLGSPGEIRTSGSATIWSTGKGSTRTVFLTMIPKGESTLVRLEESMQMEARGTVAGGGVVGMMAGLLSLAAFKTVLGTAAKIFLGPALVVGVGAGWLIGRQVWKRSAARREQQLKKAFAALVAVDEAEVPALTEAAASEVQGSDDRG